jgi:hypothetical protein
MKNELILFLVICTAFVSNAQHLDVDTYNLDKLHGKIKEYVSISFYIDENGKLDKTKITGTDKIVVDKNNNIIEGLHFSVFPAGKYYSRNTREYDENGRLFLSKYYDDSGKMYQRSMLFYDNTSDVRNREEIYDSQDKLLHYKIYKYIENELKLEIFAFQNTLLESKQFIWFNENHKELKYESYKDNELIEKTVFEYDSFGNLIEYSYYYKSNNSIEKDKFIYKGDKIITSESYSDDNMTSKCVYKYHLGRYEAFVFNSDGSKRLVNYYLADKMGNIKRWEQYFYQKDGTKILSLYKESTYNYY